MKQKIWAKTLLTSYNCLDNIASAIDSLVVNQGVNSSRNKLSTLENAEKIINLIQRKKLLINLKVLIENIMSKIDANNARLLVLKYFDRLNTEVMIEVLSMTRRTFFRRVDRALEQFGNELVASGYDHDSLNLVLGKENWIKEIFNGFNTEEAEEEDGISEVAPVLNCLSIKPKMA